ncbi:MAG: caspase family protein, partial [Candidatus Tectomicrobia bacterium]|nr:caspase family protein [Candidatus Tectomicrobia bacterium]
MENVWMLSSKQVIQRAVSWLLAAMCLMLLSHVELWAQSKGLNVEKTGGTGEHRLALLIGNAAYDTAPLRNPVNDVRSMTATLRALGFTVNALENAPLNKMKQAIDDFGEALRRGGGVGLFYFSGHGMQVKGRNFIIPIGAQVKGERDIEYESVDVGRVLGKMEDAGNRVNLVILDACRDNPFARSFRSAAAGLASMDAASGTFVAYATAPGRTADDGSGSNGLYTEQLIRYMKLPGLKVEDVFKRVRVDVEQQSSGKQVPWESSSLKGDFYFAGPPPDP